jgi:hypothetical protein
MSLVHGRTTLGTGSLSQSTPPRSCACMPGVSTCASHLNGPSIPPRARVYGHEPARSQLVLSIHHHGDARCACILHVIDRACLWCLHHL